RGLAGVARTKPALVGHPPPSRRSRRARGRRDDVRRREQAARSRARDAVERGRPGERGPPVAPHVRPACRGHPIGYPAAMPMFDWVLFALLALLFPLWGATFGVRRLKRAASADRSRVRLSVYRGAIVLEWIVTILILAHWIAARPA